MNQSIVFFTSKYLKFYQDLDNFKIRCSLHKILICKELIILLKADLKETIKKIQYFFFDKFITINPLKKPSQESKSMPKKDLNS
jgi:hypothetical protein